MYLIFLRIAVMNPKNPKWELLWEQIIWKKEELPFSHYSIGLLVLPNDLA